MSDAGLGRGDADLLVEAARVFNQAGAEYSGASVLVAQAALDAVKRFSADDKKDDKKQAARRAAYGDSVALRLSGRTPGGYAAALALLDEIIGGTAPDPDTDGRLHLLRALANGQKYTDMKKKNDTKRQDLLPTIRADLASSLDSLKTDENKRYFVKVNQHFWKPDSPQDDEGDLVEAYADDGQFRALVDPLAS